MANLSHARDIVRQVRSPRGFVVLAGEGTGAAKRTRGPIPVDAFPWVDALVPGTVDFDGTVVVNSLQKATVSRRGLIRYGRATIGRIEGGKAYRRGLHQDERYVGSVSEVRTRDYSLVYLYDGHDVPIGVLLFEQDAIPPDDPQLHLRLAGAALICCQRAPRSCTAP